MEMLGTIVAMEYIKASATGIIIAELPCRIPKATATTTIVKTMIKFAAVASQNCLRFVMPLKSKDFN
jgi:hypothetical protein